MKIRPKVKKPCLVGESRVKRRNITHTTAEHHLPEAKAVVLLLLVAVILVLSKWGL
jgi:hypothetical protein